MIHKGIIFLILISFLLACHREELRISGVSPEEVSTPTEKPTLEVVNEESININGKQILLSKPKKTGTDSTYETKTLSGKPVKVTLIIFGIPKPVLIENPFKKVGDEEGLIRIIAVRELRVNNKVFCYEFTASYDPELGSNKGMGHDILYRVYDWDGDAKFKSATRTRDFLVPAWVLK